MAPRTGYLLPMRRRSLVCSPQSRPPERRASHALEARPLAREGGVPRAAVFGTVAALHESLLDEAIDEEGDSAAGDEDPLLDLAEERLPAMMEQLEDGELPDRQPVGAHVGRRLLVDGGVGASQGDPELEGQLLVGGEVGGGRRRRLLEFRHIS